jgi:hypothetical protein
MSKQNQMPRAARAGAHVIGRPVYIGPRRRRLAQMGALLPAADFFEVDGKKQQQT